MHDWNAVFLRYCDGASFASASESMRGNGSTLHFQGYANFRLILSELLHGVEQTHVADWAAVSGGQLALAPSLRDATDVVVAGCSAGGVAAALHAIGIQDQLRDGTRVVALLDGAFFPDWKRELPSGQPAPELVWRIDEQLQWIFANFGISHSGAVPEACAKHFGIAHWRCMFLEHLLPWVAHSVPVFVFQSRFDTSNLESRQKEREHRGYNVR
jgi:hypothetical protein